MELLLVSVAVVDGATERLETVMEPERRDADEER